MDREEAAETPGPQVKGQRDTVAWIRKSGNRGRPRKTPGSRVKEPKGSQVRES